MDENWNSIEKIILYEWEMFTSVNEGEEKVSCQEDRITFEAMRAAQFKAWSPAAVSSYLDDLEAARKSGRNLIEEKYIHMMETTEPSRYNALLPRITAPSDTVRAIASEVSDMLLDQTRVMFELYPFVSGRGRPLYSTFDDAYISVETYQLCELLTYSEKTLSALKEHVERLAKDKISLARLMLENTVKFYGYESLDTAEAAARARADEVEIQVSFGCNSGNCDI